MTPQADGLHFRPKNLEQKALSYLHFIETSQGNTSTQSDINWWHWMRCSITGQLPIHQTCIYAESPWIFCIIVSLFLIMTYTINSSCFLKKYSCPALADCLLDMKIPGDKFASELSSPGCSEGVASETCVSIPIPQCLAHNPGLPVGHRVLLLKCRFNFTIRFERTGALVPQRSAVNYLALDPGQTVQHWWSYMWKQPLRATSSVETWWGLISQI